MSEEGGASNRPPKIIPPLISSHGDEDYLSNFDFIREATVVCTPVAPTETPAASSSIGNGFYSPTQTNLVIDRFEDLDSRLEFNLEADSTPTERSLPSSHELFYEQQQRLWLEPHDGFPLSKERLMMEISLFFHQGYVAYPFIHYETFMESINDDRHLSDQGFGSLVLSIVMLNEAIKVRLSSQHDQHAIRYLARTIEDLRTGPGDYHFAEDPSVDTVIVSLFLFIAYNVSDKHNRAFFYLTEAIGLFDLLGEPSDAISAIRQQRLCYILYVAESATISIYGSPRKRMISPRPLTPLKSASSLSWYNNEDFQRTMEGFAEADIVTTDKQAVDLLLLMTRLHLATEVSEVAKITVDDQLLYSITRSLGNGAGHHNGRADTQIADVAITRQWKLAELWWNEMSRQPALASSEGAINCTIEMIATTALTWSKTLKPGYLRIVGLGKLVGLTDSIFNISSRLGSVGRCTALIRHLIQTVAETDYDRYFAPQLGITEICIGDIPRSLMYEDQTVYYDNDGGVL